MANSKGDVKQSARLERQLREVMDPAEVAFYYMEFGYRGCAAGKTLGQTFRGCPTSLRPSRQIPKNGPTASRQDEVYEYVVNYFNDHGVMPTQKMIAVDLQIHPGSLHRMLDRLVEDGRFVRVEPQMPYRFPST